MMATNNMAGVGQGLVSVPASHIIVQQLGQQPASTTKFITTTLNVNQQANTGQQMTFINPPQQTSTSTETAVQVLPVVRLNELVRETDPNLQLEEDVEETLVSLADDFIDNVINGACRLAKHRHVPTIEVKDLLMFLDKNYNMWIPGFGTDELRPYKRSALTESHKQRLALIRRTLKKY